MTDGDILREAGLGALFVNSNHGLVKRMALSAMVQARTDEREVCAALCEGQAIKQDEAYTNGITYVGGDLAYMCATAIREHVNGQSGDELHGSDKAEGASDDREGIRD